MTEASERRVVRIRRVLSATPERVFDAWTNAGKVARWMSPVGHAVADIEARPGGRLHVTMVGEGRQIEHIGEYRELVPGRRLVFTWQSPYTGPVPSLVTVELAEHEHGTELTLTHDALPAETVESHAGGWGSMLDRLAAELEATPMEEAAR